MAQESRRQPQEAMTGYVETQSTWTLDDDDDEDTRSTHEQLAEFLDQSFRK